MTLRNSSFHNSACLLESQELFRKLYLKSLHDVVCGHLILDEFIRVFHISRVLVHKRILEIKRNEKQSSLVIVAEIFSGLLNNILFGKVKHNETLKNSFVNNFCYCLKVRIYWFCFFVFFCFFFPVCEDTQKNSNNLRTNRTNFNKNRKE
jgi:hypothetical protein